MLDAFLIDTSATLPGAFLLFLTAAIVICVIGEWILGRRWGEEPLRWAAVIAAGIFGAVVGSKVYMSDLGAWAPALAGGTLPSVHGKNLLGAVAGTLVATWGLRWLLGYRARFEDALGLVLPLAILVGRFGCLFAGCCHGTVTDVPWAMRYGAGSLAHHHHVAQGLLAHNAEASLAIHPAQLYEILLVAALVPLVFWAHRRLNRRGSTLLVTILGYGAIRFGQEFLRYGGAEAGGLKQVQWALLVVVVAAALLLWVLERRSGAPSPLVSKTLSPLSWGVLAGLGALAAWTTFTWFGHGERFCALLACIPLAWHGVEILAARLLPAIPSGWRRLLPASVTAVALAAWMPLYKVEKGPPEKRHALRVELGGEGGQQRYTYSDGCEDIPETDFMDHAWAMQGTVAYQYHISDRQYFETGLTGYGGRYGRTLGPSNGLGFDRKLEVMLFPDYYLAAPVTYGILGFEPYFGFEGYWWAAHLGVHAFGSPELRKGGVMGAGLLRLGPKDVAFIDIRFLHDQPILTGPVLQMGLGVTMGPVGHLRFGLVGFDQGFYLQPHFQFPVGDMEVTLSPGYWVNFKYPHTSGGISLSGGLVIPLD